MIKLQEKKIDVSEKKFWSEIKIFHDYPQTFNKQVTGAKIICSFELCDQENNPVNILQYLVDNLSSYVLKNERIDENIVTQVLQVKKIAIKMHSNSEYNDIFSSRTGICLTVRSITPKGKHPQKDKFYEISLLDFGKNAATFQPLTNRFIYKNIDQPNKKMAKYESNPIQMVILKYKILKLSLENKLFIMNCCDDACVKEKSFLEGTFTKMCKKLVKIDNSVNRALNSLVNQDKYNELYSHLKEKYGIQLVKDWPECTDPKKYVYEEIGIATYLLLLWKKKQNFYDLGCGNGLLVYLLNSEGHNGVGLDVKRRKIWDMYPETTILKEETVVPSPNSIYPEADWLIGNHSDELTAWIPIMSARSNNKCNFFILPCCPYQLNGKNYQRKNSKLSCYQDFFNYLQNICDLSGYNIKIDKLKIPSTKRTCIVGYKKSGIDGVVIEENIKKFIDEEVVSWNQACGSVNENNSDNWFPNFTTRQPIEKVRNCTKLPKNIIEEILKYVCEKLLSEENFLEIKQNNLINRWNQGGQVKISDLVTNIPKEYLQYLKQECKGLQTLLKNHHSVFYVNKGLVMLRSPQELLTSSQNILNSEKKFKWKEKDCWFFKNHPNNCPILEEECSFKH